MDLSIIIPVYNVENYISQCILSLLNQNIDSSRFEIILIDDGSTDKSNSIVKTFTSDYSNIHLYTQENLGVSTTRNKGIKLAQGKYICFVDSDDYIANNTLGVILEICLKNKLDLIEFKALRNSSRTMFTTTTPNLSSDSLNIVTGKEYIANRYFEESVCAYFYRANFLKEHNARFIDGRIMEDMIFNADQIYKSKRITRYPLDVYRYVRNPNSIWTSNEPKKLRKSIYDFVFMTFEFSKFIEELEKNNVNSNLLKVKQQTMLFNIVKRILKSNLSTKEINQIIQDFKNEGIYPMTIYPQHSLTRKMITRVFNNKYLFHAFVSFYKIFKYPIEQFIIRRYQRKKALK